MPKKKFSNKLGQTPSFNPMQEFKLRGYKNVNSPRVQSLESAESELAILNISNEVIGQKQNLVRQIKKLLAKLTTYPEKAKEEILNNLEKASLKMLVKIFAKLKVAYVQEQVLIFGLVNLSK